MYLYHNVYIPNHIQTIPNSSITDFLGVHMMGIGPDEFQMVQSGFCGYKSHGGRSSIGHHILVKV